jgi:hypothetical protein
VKLIIGDGAFIPTPDNLKEWIAGSAKKPSLPKLVALKEVIVEEPVTFKREEAKPDPKIFEDEFAG